MMQLSAQGEHFIKGFEKLRLVGYLPTPNDRPTAGWGHTGKGVSVGVEYPLSRCETWFCTDTQDAIDAVNKLVKVPLTQGQFDALVSFAFNCGVDAFAKSTMLRKLNARDYVGASAEFPRWDKQAGKVLNGLTRRRAGERAMFDGAV